MFFGQACTVVARDTFEWTQELGICENTKYYLMLQEHTDSENFKIQSLILITDSSKRCNCSDSGSG